MQIKLHIIDTIQVHWRGKSKAKIEARDIPLSSACDTGNIRYLVFPHRPLFTRGQSSEEPLGLAGTPMETAKGIASYREVGLDLGSTKVKDGCVSSVVTGSTQLPSPNEAHAHLKGCANGFSRAKISCISATNVRVKVFRAKVYLQTKRRLSSVRDIPQT